MNPGQLFKAGQLLKAIDAASQKIKENPSDVGNRYLLAELLCFSCQYDRADNQLDVLASQAPEMILGISDFRQLIRAEQARQKFFNEGALPEFLEEPADFLQLYLKASIEIREKNIEIAESILESAEVLRPKLQGISANCAFRDLRDLDDLTASIWEVLTAEGKYYWIPFSAIKKIQFFRPEAPRDLLWRKASIETAKGLSGEVYIPVIYPIQSDCDELTLLGRTTDWKGVDSNAPIRGMGQRTLLIGDDALPLMDVESIEINLDSTQVTTE